MGKAELSHHEVWDDSDLLNSWNDAFAEYKKYHSLATKGEKIPAEQLQNGVTPINEEAADISIVTDGLPSSEARASKDANEHGVNGTATMSANQPSLNANGVTVPQILLNAVQDEGLKNLMMSWYYAGYYTGLYEGQQKTYASAQQDR